MDDGVWAELRAGMGSGELWAVVGLSAAALIVTVLNISVAILACRKGGLQIRVFGKSLVLWGNRLLLNDCYRAEVRSVTAHRARIGWNPYIKDTDGPRSRYASTLVWSLLWRSASKQSLIADMLRSTDIASTEILEELLADSTTRRLVLRRVSAGGWAWIAPDQNTLQRDSILEPHMEARLRLCLLAIPSNVTEDIDTTGLARLALASKWKETRLRGIELLAQQHKRKSSPESVRRESWAA